MNLENKECYSELERSIVIGLRRKIDWARGLPTWQKFTDEAAVLLDKVIDDIDFDDFLISAMRTVEKQTYNDILKSIATDLPAKKEIKNPTGDMVSDMIINEENLVNIAVNTFIDNMHFKLNKMIIK